MAQIGIFAKHWTPGNTKTRLAKALGNELAADCSKEFLKTTLLRLASLDHGKFKRLLAYAPTDREQAFSHLIHELGIEWSLVGQPDGDLGNKMAWFFQQAFDSGHDLALLLGSDSPDFPLEAIERGLDWLAEPNSNRPGKLVLGPATDGGYWCVGARGVVPPIFEEMPWSQPDLLEKSIKALDQLGWKAGSDYLLLDQWYDVDTIEDLHGLQARIHQLRSFQSDTSQSNPLKKLNEWIETIVSFD